MRNLLIGFLMLGSAVLSAQQGEAVPYDRMPNAEQKAAINYMITTLGNAGVFSLAGKRSTLKAEGDKTATLHPLRVFLYIFENPKLRADLKKMRSRSMVWRNFMHGQPDGWDNTFNAQANLGNMKEAYINDYAETLGIAPGPLWAQVEKRDWTGLIDITFKELGQPSQASGQTGNGHQPARARQRASTP
jgi:hypothetical protein